MSVRPLRTYAALRYRGKTFAKRGFFHTRGAWRARNFYKRTFRRRTEQEEEDDDPPQICDEVGADDEEGEEEEVENKDEDSEKNDKDDAEDEEEKKDGDNETDEREKEEPKVEDAIDDTSKLKEVKSKDVKLDEKEKLKEQPVKEKLKEKPDENAAVAGKDDIEDIMLSGEWEVMDETDDEDDEPSRKRSRPRSNKSDSFTLAIEVAVPEIAEKLKEVTDPLVGLEYIVEIKNELDCTYYSCLLCKRPGRIAAILRHLNYIEHKMRYLERHLGECASAFPSGNPTTFKHEYLVAMEKVCQLLGETNERRETLLITTKDFYTQKMRALAFRAEQLPHMTFKDDAWKKVFEGLGLPTKPTTSRRRVQRSRSRDRERRSSRSHDRERRSRSRDRYRDNYRDNYRDRGDSYSYGYRGRGRGRYNDYVPYQQFRYNNYYGNDWGNDRGGYDSRTPYYYYEDRSGWNDYRNQGYYHRDEDTRYGEYEHRGRSSYKRYEERESRSSYSHHDDAVESSRSTSVSGARVSGAIFATTIKKRPAAEKPPVASSKKEVVKKTSAADVKKLWDKLTKPEEHKKKEEEDSKSFWDQWLDVHDEEDANSKGSNEVMIIDQVSSAAGGPKEVNSDLNSVAELLDKNLTQIMNSYDPNSGPMFPAKSAGTGATPSDKAILAQKIAKALTTIGMGKIPQETLILILQQLGLLPGGHTRSHQSRAMDNLRKTIVKFDSVSRNFPR